MSADPARGPASPSAPSPRRRPRIAWWVAFAVALFAVNYWVGSRATQHASRVRVPYSPFFLEQVRAGEVDSITSKGTAIQGTFEHPQSYSGSKATTKFETEIPTFANTDA